jgi:predicted MFS family arabinose efflux permease
MIDLPVEVGRARIGSAATFTLAGALCAVWTVRIPALTDKLHLDPAGVGTAVLLFGIGAMITMQLARVAIPRLGSRRTLLLAAPGSAAMSAGIGIAPTYPWLLVAAGLALVGFFLLGLAVCAVDVTAPARPVDMARAAHRRWAVYRSSGGPNHGR